MKEHICVAPPKYGSVMKRGLIRMRSLANFSKRWERGQIIYYSIRKEANDGEVRNIQSTANEIGMLTGLYFVQTQRPDADIRIAFKRRTGSWSAVGTDARTFPLDQPTMNFGWDVSRDIGTVRHEFGHAVGLGHEHQNPAGGLQWDQDKVVAALSGPPNNWTLGQIKTNVLDYAKLVPGGWTATTFDPHSVMLYQFPDNWLKDGRHLPKRNNTSYSLEDKKMLAKMYGVKEHTHVREVWWKYLLKKLFGRR